jgi:diguanylate cyclase (GGDEF)-like protein/PAS domain S-box-containing protein
MTLSPSQLSIGQKVVFVFALGLIILLVISIISYNNISAMIDSGEWHETSHQTLTVLEGLFSNIKDIEGGQRGYVITGQESYLAPYHHAVETVDVQIRALKVLMKDNPRQLDRLNRVTPLLAQKVRYSERVIKTRHDEGGLAAMKLVRTGRGLRIMENIRKGLTEMEDDVNGQLKERDALVRTSARRAVTAIVFGNLFAIAIFIAASMIILRELTQRIQTEKALRESEEGFRLLIDGVKDYAIVSLDPFGLITSWNTGAERISGYRSDEILGKHFSLFYPNEEVDLGKPDHALKMAGQDGRYEEECWHVHKNGSKFWANIIITALHDEHGKVRGYSKVTRDISDRRRSEESMRKLSMSVEQATDLIVLTDPAGNIEYINKAVEEITGYARNELIGKNRDLWRSGEYDEKFFADMKETLLSGKPFQAIFTNRKKDGELFYVYEVITPLRDPAGAITHFVSTGRDITQQRTMEERLNYLAYYDALTGIPNRALFIDRLTQGIARGRYAKKIIAVLIIDIDRFKFINDGYGLPVGDRVLRTVTERLASSIREGDTEARLGSDDFGIILFDVAETGDIILVVKKIMEVISQPIKMRGEDIVLTASLGISVYPYDGESTDDLMKNADIALSKAKLQGRNSYQFYTRDMNVKAMEFVSIDKRLFNSYKNREFMLFYQPYWDVLTQKLMGMEALIRWNSTTEGVISPDRFIPVLEDTGLIIQVGDWITSSVCMQIRDWLDRGYTPVPVSVNLSSVQFRKKDLAESILSMVEQARIDPKLLTMEITESTFMQNVDFASSVFKKLKEKGITISLDDFGTGYSSLSYLKKFPFDNLKIDISFIRDLTLESDASTIVTAIIAMARSLNLKSIAEGVETEELWKILRLLKCDMVQGNYFCPALPPKGVEIYFEGTEKEMNA